MAVPVCLHDHRSYVIFFFYSLSSDHQEATKEPAYVQRLVIPQYHSGGLGMR